MTFHVQVQLDFKRMAATSDSLDSTYLFHQLDDYPWDSDQEFQGGLQAILGSVQNQAQLEHLTLRAKCYYYARKTGTPVDFEGYKRWVEGGRNGELPSEQVTSIPIAAQPPPPSEPQQTGVGGMSDAPKPASFAEICELIAEGKPIPGIKDIPDTILEGQSSTSQVTQRKKPWEKDGNIEGPSWMK